MDIAGCGGEVLEIVGSSSGSSSAADVVDLGAWRRLVDDDDKPSSQFTAFLVNQERARAAYAEARVGSPFLAQWACGALDAHCREFP